MPLRSSINFSHWYLSIHKKSMAMKFGRIITIQYLNQIWSRYPRNLLIPLDCWSNISRIYPYDLGQPKTSTFSTCTHIWVHSKVAHSFYQKKKKLIFTSKWCMTQFSHLILSCSETINNNLRIFRKFAHSFVAIELLTFSKMQNFIFIAQGSSHYFG